MGSQVVLNGWLRGGYLYLPAWYKTLKKYLFILIDAIQKFHLPSYCLLKTIYQ